LINVTKCIKLQRSKLDCRRPCTLWFKQFLPWFCIKDAIFWPEVCTLWFLVKYAHIRIK